MIRPIVRYGADVLHTPASPVTQITPEIQQLVDDMVQTMYAAPGVGLPGALGKQADRHRRSHSAGPRTDESAERA